MKISLNINNKYVKYISSFFEVSQNKYSIRHLNCKANHIQKAFQDYYNPLDNFFQKVIQIWRYQVYEKGLVTKYEWHLYQVPASVIGVSIKV